MWNVGQINFIGIYHCCNDLNSDTICLVLGKVHMYETDFFFVNEIYENLSCEIFLGVKEKSYFMSFFNLQSWDKLASDCLNFNN
jgi:hypothetical protein